MDTEPVQRSILNWAVAALGPYAILLPLAGLVCFVLVLILVVRGKGPMAAASLILIVPIPLLIGVFAALQGMMASYSLMAAAAVAPKPSEVAEGISTALIAPSVGMIVMGPALATAVIGSFFRAMSPENQRRLDQ